MFISIYYYITKAPTKETVGANYHANFTYKCTAQQIVMDFGVIHKSPVYII